MRTVFRFAGSSSLAAFLAAAALAGDVKFDDLVRTPEKYEGKKLQIDDVLLSGDLTKGSVRYRLTLKSAGVTTVDAEYHPTGVAFVTGFDTGDKFKPLLKEGEFRAVRLTCEVKPGGAKSKDKWLAHVSSVELVPEADTAKSVGQPDKPGPKKGGRKAEADESSTIVVCEGVGKSSDEALKDALRNAVRQVVGALVDAETVVKNDEVISDKVLTYSAGLVKKYDEVSSKNKDGLFRITIRATVERTDVAAKLKAANVVVKAVDGKGLFAEVVTGLEKEKDAKVLLAKKLREYRSGIVKVETVGEPKVKKAGDTDTTIECTIRLTPDTEKYTAFCKELLPLLGRTAVAKGTVRTTTEKNDKDHSYWSFGDLVGTASRQGFFGGHGGFKPVWADAEKALGKSGPTHRLVVVCSQISTLGDKQTWEWFVVPATDDDRVSVNVHVGVIDRQKRELTSNDFLLPADEMPGIVKPHASSGKCSDLVLAPLLLQIKARNEFYPESFVAQDMSAQVAFKVATADLKQITGVRSILEIRDKADEAIRR